MTNREHLRIPASERFWKFVNKTETCWLWIGKINKFGYGRFWSYDQKEISAHRFAFEISSGNRNGLLVLHRCDVRNCVRPDHLFSGTQSDNIRDAIAKGRFIQISSDHQRARSAKPRKLTLNQAEVIREIYGDGKHSQQEIADMFNVSQGTISHIVLRRYTQCYQ